MGSLRDPKIFHQTLTIQQDTDAGGIQRIFTKPSPFSKALMPEVTKIFSPIPRNWTRSWCPRNPEYFHQTLTIQQGPDAGGIQNISTKPSPFSKALMPEASHIYSKTVSIKTHDPGGVAYVRMLRTYNLQFTILCVQFRNWCSIYGFQYSIYCRIQIEKIYYML